jgi:hypothetical protein
MVQKSQWPLRVFAYSSIPKKYLVRDDSSHAIFEERIKNRRNKMHGERARHYQTRDCLPLASLPREIVRASSILLLRPSISAGLEHTLLFNEGKMPFVFGCDTVRLFSFGRDKVTKGRKARQTPFLGSGETQWNLAQDNTFLGSGETQWNLAQDNTVYLIIVPWDQKHIWRSRLVKRQLYRFLMKGKHIMLVQVVMKPVPVHPTYQTWRLKRFCIS